jgi:hypothetical protein
MSRFVFLGGRITDNRHLAEAGETVMKRLPSESETLQCGWTLSRDKQIGGREQPTQAFHVAGRLEVQGYDFMTGVQFIIEFAFIMIHRVAVRRLHLDHARAPSGQSPGRRGTG